MEDLDEDVVRAVADRHLAQPAKRDTTGTRREKLSKKAAKRAAIRAARAKPKKGTSAAASGRRTGTRWSRRARGTTGATAARRRRAFLARRDANGKNKRASSMLLDPKTGKPLRAGGVTALGVGKKRRR